MKPIIEVHNLYYQVEELQIINGITLDISKEEDLVITGPSGSGKSTLLKLLGTLVTPSSGEILYKEMPIGNYNPAEYRKKVSYFFQNPQLFGQTVEENLRFPYEIRQQPFSHERSGKLLEQVALDSTFLSKKVHELSGGEKQRVALVRNLQYLPEVLLLDEVTSSLDSETAIIVRRFLKQLQKDEHITLVRVTHVAEEIEEASRLLTFENGLIGENK